MSQEITDQINQLKSLKGYQICKLVEDAKSFGGALKRQGLETNQIRKFLDAINQIKAKLVLAQADDKNGLAVIETVCLLKPKLAYAAARQNAVKPLNQVLSTAIDKTKDKEDFERLVQLIESIIAYHRAEGGK